MARSRVHIPHKFRKDMTLGEIHEYVERTSRRRFLKGSLATAGAATLGPHLWMQPASAQAAPPAGVHLALGTDPRTEMSVVWSTPGPASNPRLSFGIEDEAGTTVGAETRTVPDNLLVDVQGRVDTRYHHVRLRGLEPGTTYRYRLAHQGGELGDLTFTTAPAGPAPFTFTAYGDQDTTAAARHTSNLVASIRPAFNIVAGDLCYANDLGFTIPTDLTAFEPSDWDTWFGFNSVAAAFSPMMPSMGNHDVEPGYGDDGFDGHGARLSLPQGGFNRWVHTFRYGNVAVVALDANDVSTEIPHPHGNNLLNIGQAPAQTAWMDRELGALRADPDIDFIVVHFHHCAFSTIKSHGSDGGVRRRWVPVFDRHQVDLVINGHNHGYERTTPIRHGVPTTESPDGATVRPADHGTTYICAGGGGRHLSELSEPGQGFIANEPITTFLGAPLEPEAAPWSVTAVLAHSLIKVDVTPPGPDGVTTMAITALDTQGGGQFDSVTLVRQGTPAPTPQPEPTGVLPALPRTGGRDLLVPAALAATGALATAAAARRVQPADDGTDCSTD